MRSLIAKSRRIVSAVFHRLGDRLDPDLVHLGRDGFGNRKFLRLAPGDTVDALYQRVFPGLDQLPHGNVQDKAKAIKDRLSKLPLNKQLELLGYPPIVVPHRDPSPEQREIEERIYQRIQRRMANPMRAS